MRLSSPSLGTHRATTHISVYMVLSASSAAGHPAARSCRKGHLAYTHTKVPQELAEALSAL